MTAQYVIVKCEEYRVRYTYGTLSFRPSSFRLKYSLERICHDVESYIFRKTFNCLVNSGAVYPPSICRLTTNNHK